MSDSIAKAISTMVFLISVSSAMVFIISVSMDHSSKMPSQAWGAYMTLMRSILAIWSQDMT